MKTPTPCGAWPSPIQPESLLQGALGLSGLQEFDGKLYWMESRPAEAGRTTIVCLEPDGRITERIPETANARTTVHEYGGICFTLAAQRVWFSNYVDQRIHWCDLHDPDLCEPHSPADGSRWADLIPDEERGRLIAVREVHGPRGNATDVVNHLAALSLEGDAQAEVLRGGRDFYASPRLSPDGSRLCWLEWDHPWMPWDAAELWVADVDAGGALSNARHVAGDAHESVFQPDWMPDGRLVFMSDRNGFWNPVLLEHSDPQPLLEHEHDFALPLWQFGMRTWCPWGSDAILCSWHASGATRLGRLDLASRTLTELELPFSSLDQPTVIGDRIAVIGAGPQHFPALVTCAPDGSTVTMVRSASSLELPGESISHPRAICFPASDTGEDVHAFFYAPTHREVQAAASERPPLVVMCHGGPTGATAPVLSLKVQFWTSRGFAVLDVDYRGSTGYGRAYRNALRGRWGEADVLDCVAGAAWVAEQGWVDASRMVIRGSSAGGLTTLGALAFHDVFRAGTSMYGVTDLEALAGDTHKFESRYLDGLVGPLPEAREVYQARSPRLHARGIDAPALFLQGLEDRIVPPSQSEAMVDALDARQVPVAYLTFEGEQHGFRQAANATRALQAELWFYGRILGFEPADDIEPFEIRNFS